MSRICEVCGKKPVAGRSYARRGLAKSKGGVGRKITGITKRRFRPNIQVVRILDDKGAVRRARICVKCLKTGLRKGTIRKAIRKSRPPKVVLEQPRAEEPVVEVEPQLEAVELPEDRTEDRREDREEDREQAVESEAGADLPLEASATEGGLEEPQGE